MLSNLKGVIIHVVIILLLTVAGFYYLFYVYLPTATNHGETITVPDLEGMSLKEVEEKLGKNTLQFVVTDSTAYNPRFKPSTVMNQVPEAHVKVKENRKIYISINAKDVPLVELPDLSNKSLRNALIKLESVGLKKDSVVYKPYNSPVVIGQTYKGKSIEAGDKIPKGEKIGLIVGLTEGNNKVKVPDLIGREYKGLKKYLEGYGLILSARWVEENDMPDNVVFKQSPMPFDTLETAEINTVVAGSIIDVWISGKEPKDSIY